MCSCSSHEAGSIERDKVNRISDLPDCVMSNILSCLPTKQAMRTFVLSKDWKYKWTSIYNIDFDGETKLVEHYCLVISFYLDDETKLLEHYCLVESFCNFVDKVLHNFLDSDHDLRIQSVCFDLKYQNHDPYRVMTWISNIFSLHVKNFSIIAPRARFYVVLPGDIENLTPLSELSLLIDFVWKVRINNYFPNLKRLYLTGGVRGFQIVNEQSPETGQLSLTFPVLEILELDHFQFINAESVEVTVPELVSFTAHYSENYSEINSEIKIFAPKLAKFELYGVFDTYVLCTQSLCQATLLHENENGPTEKLALQASSLLTSGARNLKTLHLSGSIVKAILAWEGVQVLPIFNLLKQLKLYDSITGKDLLVFLQVIPCLEYLTLCDIRGHFSNKELQGSLPPCIVAQLKRVVFLNFRGNSNEVSLANMFLKNAMELEKVVVYLERRCNIHRWLRTLGPKSSSRLTVIDTPK